MLATMPVRYSPDVEQIEADEGETIAQLKDAFREILETTSKDYGRAVRSVHAKAHGLARGTLTVAGDLPAELAQGIFARPGRYEAVIRLSTNAGDILPDAIGLPRGLALKVIGVEGERLPGSEGDATQDFIMVNGPVFTAPDAKAFLKNLKLLAKTTDKAEGGKTVLSKVLRGVEAGLEAIGHPSPTLQQLGGAPHVHPLGETYYSQTPYRYGDHIAKIGLFPVSSELLALTNETVDTSKDPDALRAAVREELVAHGGIWELRVQLNTDLDAMPVEDPRVEWDQAQSPFITVATLEVPAQNSWADAESEKTDEALSYNIWHGIAAHRPLGNVNRARKDTYIFSSDFRSKFNGCPMHEPARLAEPV
ncbi:catalase family protein [Sphingomonas sp. RP10(2022)]|uniref:Catalase family protein n=1 Tax=Sphingomonas liriopis TaxID=2949094 RepID=A0A9X2HQ57_9SPHN|nr:catalase family protein [Sphingomonas liriopis]MCP3733777.1 catalase family protein [Sphingomonas liriopis]